MLFDTHAHLNFSAFDKDRYEVIKRCLDDDVWMINVGTNYETSKMAVEIAERYPQGVYAAIGLHPINLETKLVKNKTDESEGGRFEEGFDYWKYKELAKSKKVVAVGEIGLDYWYRPKTRKKLELFKQKQKELLLQELGLASELNLPVIFHCRLAHDDLLRVLELQTTPKESPVGDPTGQAGYKLQGVIHCFTGAWEQAQKFLDMGLYLGFNGIIFKLNLDEIIKKTPLDRILIETDCPYLLPPRQNFGGGGALIPFQNQRNEPLYVKYVAEKIAEIKNTTFEKIAKITLQNTKALFKI